MLGILLAGGLSISAVFSGVFLTAPSEGKINHSYHDAAGILTACYGHTGSDVKLGQSYTDGECLEWLINDLNKEDQDVKQIIRVPLNVYQQAALDDFMHNVGKTQFANSTLVKLFNQGDYVGGCDQLTRWVYADGKKLKGLEARRELEKEWCLSGVEVKTE